MKSKVVSLLLAASLFISACSIRNAEAGMAFNPTFTLAQAGNFYLVWFGTTMGDLGLLIATDGCMATKQEGNIVNGGKWLCNTEIGGVVGLSLIGLFFLDDNNSVAIKFAPVTVDQADQAGFTSEETIAYNNSIDEINAIAATVNVDLTGFEASGLAQAAAIEKSSALLSQYTETSLTPEARSALAKLRTFTAKQIQAQR